MHYKDLAMIENSTVKNNKWSKILQLTEEEPRWLDLKHIWAPWWTRKAHSLLSKQSCNIKHRRRQRALMFAPLCCELGCFAQGRRPTIMTSLRTRAGVYQRRRGSVSYSSIENIHMHIHPCHPWRESFPFFKGSNPLATHEKLQNIKYGTGKRKIKNTKTLGWKRRRVIRRGNSLKE